MLFRMVNLWTVHILTGFHWSYLALVDQYDGKLQSHQSIQLWRSLHLTVPVSYQESRGHTISAEGLRPSSSKIQAIAEVSQPTNVTQLKVFLGILNYYAKFLPDLATKLAPLYKLLRQDKQWEWSGSETVVVYPKLTSTFWQPETNCDCLWCISFQHRSCILEDGTEHSVAYPSCSLSPAEKRYSQLDKEALAIVFSVGKFHHYIFGQKFLSYSDHKPLTHIFGES